jgi:hypothetical protein
MEPGLLPTDRQVNGVELQVLRPGLPVTLEPLGNTDPVDPDENEVDAPLPLGVRLTQYSLFMMAVVFAYGVAKFILLLQGHPIALTGFEWVVISFTCL